MGKEIKISVNRDELWATTGHKSVLRQILSLVRTVLMVYEIGLSVLSVTENQL